MLPADYVSTMENLINKYDVALIHDVERKKSDGDSSLNSIAVGLANLVDHYNSNPKHKRQLGTIRHPGGKTRGNDYSGLEFDQIMGMAIAGERCHNEVAEALRACLTQFVPVVDEGD
jgi:hypothetical protein